MLLDQPRDHLGLFVRHPQPWAQLQRDFGAEHRVIAAAPLGDVVKQHRDVERPPRLELVDDVDRQGVLVLELALFQPGEQTDRADGVLVDRVVVVHVELHLRVDAAEIGHETPEYAGLVEPAQDLLGIVAAGQQVEEERVGARILADPVDQPRVARDQAHRLGMDFQALGIRQDEDFQEARRVFGEPAIARHGDLPAEHAIALEGTRLGPEARQQPAWLLLGELIVELRQEHAGQVADDFRLQEKVVHEALDGALARAIREAHSRRDFTLEVEGQAVFRAAGDRVEMAAHRPEERLGAAEAAVLGLVQQSDRDQFGHVADLVDVLADPIQRVEIAQAALALFHVGFDDIAAVAQAFVPVVALGQLLGDELPLGPGDDFGPEALLRLGEQILVAPDVTSFEQRGADRQVAAAHPHHVVERAAGMADLQRQIPHEIEDRLDHLFAPGGLLGGREEGDVDVRVRRHFAAAIAADRHQRQPFAGRAIVGRIDVGDHMVMDHADQLVDQECLGLGHVVTRGRLFDQPPGDLVPPAVEGAAQQFDDLGASLRAVFGDQVRNRGGQGAAVDHRTLVGNGDRAHAGTLYR